MMRFETRARLLPVAPFALASCVPHEEERRRRRFYGAPGAASPLANAMRAMRRSDVLVALWRQCACGVRGPSGAQRLFGSGGAPVAGEVSAMRLDSTARPTIHHIWSFPNLHPPTAIPPSTWEKL